MAKVAQKITRSALVEAWDEALRWEGLDPEEVSFVVLREDNPHLVSYNDLMTRFCKNQ